MGLWNTITKITNSSMHSRPSLREDAHAQSSFKPLASPDELARSDSFIKAQQLAGHFPPGPQSKAAPFSNPHDTKRPAAWNVLMTPKYQIKATDRQKIQAMAAGIPVSLRAQKAHEKLKSILALAATMPVSPNDIVVGRDKNYASLAGRLAYLAKIRDLDEGFFTPTDDEALQYASLITESFRCHLRAFSDLVGSNMCVYRNESLLRTATGLAKYNVFSLEQKRNIAVAMLVVFMDETWETILRFQQLGDVPVTSKLVQFHKFLADTAAMIESPPDATIDGWEKADLGHRRS